MTNTELIQKIKAEIDKRYAEYREKMKSDDFTYYEGMADALDLFEQFIDSLESGKPINPDDAMKELDEKIALVKQRGTWDGVDVDKYMDEVRGREPEKPVPNDLDFEQELYNHFGQIKDFTLGMRIGKYFYELGKQSGSSEIPKDLEEAAKKFVGYDMDCDELRDYEIGIASFIAGAEWQKEQTEKRWLEDRDGCFWDGVEEGKKAMKEQMLKEAVGCDVIVPIYEGNDVWSAEIKIPGRYEPGDKVRIIIVKD